MTIAELKARLETMPDTTPVSIVIYEYERASGHGTASYLALDTVELTPRGDALLGTVIYIQDGKPVENHRRELNRNVIG